MSAPCGTNGGYLAHRRRDQAACDGCKAAHSAHQATSNAARGRALARLAKEFPERFREIYVEEKVA